MPRTRTAIISATDYYPYGMAIKSRSSVLDNNDEEKYRFGFGGQQKSTEINAQGNSYTAQFWQYDARTGRRLNIDPKPIASESPYATNRNNPILNKDPDGDFPWVGAAIGAAVGLSAELISQGISNYSQGKPILKNIDWADVITSTAEGAAIGATAGLVLLDPQFNAMAASIRIGYDWKPFNDIDPNLKYPLGKGLNAKDPNDVIKDAGGEALGLGLPGAQGLGKGIIEKFSKSSADAVKNGAINGMYNNSFPTQYQNEVTATYHTGVITTYETTSDEGTCIDIPPSAVLPNPAYQQDQPAPSVNNDNISIRLRKLD